MALIRKLPPDIIGKIAAGEVVERPASVVKELVENSIDAGAGNITVELRDGGVSYLRISDNGCGIPAEQVRLAFERHATSKLANADDLFALQTLGFRGEALASVAAVAKVTMVTRTADVPFGTRAVAEHGELTDIRQAASPVGTAVTVENLFSNVPARLKFLKKPVTEAAYVTDFMTRLILSHPEISFRFVNQGKTIYHSPGDGKLESAVLCVYGRETLQELQRVEGHMNGLLLNGYVGTGDLSRGNRQHQTFFVNGRYFRSTVLSRSVEKACGGRVMIGRFPIFILNLDLAPQLVDVNVHPNKLEVRFQNEAGICAAVETIVSEAFSGQHLGQMLQRPGSAPAAPVEKSASGKLDGAVITLAPSAEEIPEKDVSVSYVVPVPENRPKEKQPEAEKPEHCPKQPVVYAAPALHEKTVAYQVIPKKAEKPVAVPVSPSSEKEPVPVSVRAEEKQPAVAKRESSVPAPEAEQLSIPREETEKPRLAGIVFDTYWIFESGDRLLLVDQHAAHERILYDRYCRQIESCKASQVLLIPRMVRLSAAEVMLLQEHLPVLEASGFDISVFDSNTVAVRAVPCLFGVDASPKDLLLEVLDGWDDSRRQVTPDRLYKRIAQMACKHAIKGGDHLTEAEISHFLTQCLESASMPNCPHGRPIIVEMTRTELEKRFKRIQD